MIPMERIFRLPAAVLCILLAVCILGCTPDGKINITVTHPETTAEPAGTPVPEAAPFPEDTAAMEREAEERERSEAEAAETLHADMLVVLSHPGDEVTFFSGLLELYAAEKGYNCRVVYLSSGSEEQRTAAEQNLRMVGVRARPEFWDFPGSYFETEKAAKRRTREKELRGKIAAAVRRLKPVVVVTHGEDGEYGHGMHILCSRLTKLALKDAERDQQKYHVSEDEQGWKVQRLFLHDSLGDCVVTLDQNAPLHAFMEHSALYVDRLLYDASQKDKTFFVNINGEAYTKASFRLAAQAEGLEDPETDLFEGIPESMLNVPAGAAEPSAKLKKLLEQDGPAEGYPVNPKHYFTEKDAAETEAVLEDYENGHWEYHSPELSVVIDRVRTKDNDGSPVAYLTADIRMNGINAYRSGIREKRREYPWVMARRCRAVLAVTGDNMVSSERSKKGIIIRDGVIYNDRTAMDTLAIMPDLSLEIFDKGTVTAQELLDMGITDTYSFGPSLIKDGQINRNLHRERNAIRNPRVAIGMVEPGHFIAICVDGRQKKYSRGVTLNELAHLFYMKGCTEAFNLDGGASAAMVFMGEMLNRHGWEPGKNQRHLPDMMLFGSSELVRSADDPVRNHGFGRR